MGELGKVVAKPVVAGALAAVASLAFQATIGDGWTPLVRLALGGCVMLATYAWVLLYVMGEKVLYSEIYLRLASRPPAEPAG